MVDGLLKNGDTAPFNLYLNLSNTDIHEQDHCLRSKALL